MANWRTLEFQGFTVISRVAAVFQVGPPLPDPLPFARFTVKVLEKNGSFHAHLDIAVRGSDGHPNAYAGLGDSPDDALADALQYFWNAVQESGASQIEDFVSLDTEGPQWLA